VPGAKSLSPEGWLEEVMPPPFLRGTRFVLSAASRARSWSPEGWLEEVIDNGSGTRSLKHGPANAAQELRLNTVTKTHGIVVFIDKGSVWISSATDHTPAAGGPPPL
jgi:hypothetical protein